MGPFPHITGEMVKEVVAGGLSFVCAMCEHWWRAAEDGKSQCVAAQRGLKCGGPMAKMTFPEYKGPLKNLVWSEFCFVCGSKSDAGISVGMAKRMMGVCENHVQLVELLRRKNGTDDVNVKHEDVQLIAK